MDVDLEVEVATDGDRVAGLPHGADALALEDAPAAVDEGGPDEVGVEVATVLAFAVDQEVVAVEDGVVARAQDAAVADGDQRRAATGDDVEAFMGATARARGAVGADVAARPVRGLDREDMAVVGDAAVAAGDLGGSRRPERREEEKEEEKGPLQRRQWCSITRSTMLYSFASSALMK